MSGPATPAIRATGAASLAANSSASTAATAAGINPGSDAWHRSGGKIAQRDIDPAGDEQG
jgi:hypothetical protein